MIGKLDCEEERILQYLLENFMNHAPNMVYENKVDYYNHYKIEIYNNNYNGGDPEDREYIDLNRMRIKQFFDDGYVNANLGKFQSCADGRAIKKNTLFLKVVKDIVTNDIIAMTIYNSYPMGIKCAGLTKVVTDDERINKIANDALKTIIREDLKMFDKFYWCECSGVVEHWHETQGGIKIPNTYLPLFMSEQMLENVTLGEDGYSYTRTINKGSSDPMDFRKVIYGFPNKETLQKYIDDKNMKLEDLYKRFDRQLPEPLKESNVFKNNLTPNEIAHDYNFLKYYFYYIIVDENVRELTELQIQYLDKTIHSVEYGLDKMRRILPNNQFDEVGNMLDYMKYCRNNITIMKIRELGELLEPEEIKYPEAY